MKNNIIPYLKKGDLIYITAPAKAIEKELIENAKLFFEKSGYNVLISKHCIGTFNYFSGTDEERTADLQFGLDHPDIKAIICARGGYGCVRILDNLQWASFVREPKWIVGFSDVTVFHQRCQRFEIESIHGTMPLNFEENTEEALSTLLSALEGKSYSITSENSVYNQKGIVEGELIGGNLSILYSLIGTDDQIDYEGKILFIEDLSEQLYHLDRMFYSFAKAGILEKINGLIIGGMTDMKDTAIPFGKNYQEIILAHFKYRKIPICFDFPAGHINDNRALIFGRKITLEINEKGGEIKFY